MCRDVVEGELVCGGTVVDNAGAHCVTAMCEK